MAYGIRKVRRTSHHKDEAINVLIEEHNKLVADLAAARTGAAVTASKIADTSGRDITGTAVS